MYSRKFDEASIPENYAGSAFDRAEADAHPQEDTAEAPPTSEEKAAPRAEQRDGDILIPLIALWLFDRDGGKDLAPLLLLLLLWEF